MYELSTVVDAISPKDLANLKDIRLCAGIVKDLQESCKNYTDQMIELNAKQMALIKPYQVVFAEKSKEMTEEEKKKFADEENVKYQAEVKEKLAKEFKTIKEEEVKEIEANLSEDKFTKLQEVFSKYSVQFYTNKLAMLEVADALGVEE